MSQITIDYLFTDNVFDPAKLKEAIDTYRIGSLLNRFQTSSSNFPILTSLQNKHPN